jgi:hypothetical protein
MAHLAKNVPLLPPELSEPRAVLRFRLDLNGIRSRFWHSGSAPLYWPLKYGSA